MNLKRSPILSNPISVITIATIASLSYLSPSQASVTSTQKADLTAQTQLVEVPEKPSRTLRERILTQVGESTYALKDPAIQFNYDPNLLVFTSFDLEGSDIQSLLIRSVGLWSKEDYLDIKNEIVKIGEVPDGLRLNVYANPEGLSVPDWISRYPDEVSLNTEIETLTSAPNLTVAGKDAWELSYQSQFEYEGVVFEAEDNRIVVMTAHKPSATPPAEMSPYTTALLRAIESMALVAPASE